MKPVIALISLLLLCGPVLAHGNTSHNHGLSITQAWAPHTGKRTMSAAVYMTITNTGEHNDTLVEVQSALAALSMLHQSKEIDSIMQMKHVDRLDIPTGDTASLAPGGYHIMLMQLAHPLKRGEVFPLTLVFEKAGAVEIIVEITGIGGPE